MRRAASGQVANGTNRAERIGFALLFDCGITIEAASGLTLNSVVGRISDRPEVAERVQRVVDDLDDTIKTVRGTIYALHERDRAVSGTVSEFAVNVIVPTAAADCAGSCRPRPTEPPLSSASIPPFA